MTDAPARLRSVTRPQDRNVIGTHGGSYSLYRALAVSAGALSPLQRPDLANTHPVTAICRHQGCSEEAQRKCPMARDYFSEHDRFLHRTMFPRSYALGLVVNDWTFAPPSASLFGYRAGLIDVRGFLVV